MASSEGSPHIDKGKGREPSVDPSERTPLLASQSYTPHDDTDLQTTSRSRRRLWSKLIFIFLVTLSICIIAFIIVAVLAYSYAARIKLVSSDELLERAVYVKGPDRLDVLNVTDDGGIWVNVDSRVGVDAGAMIGVNSEDDDGIFRDIWKSLGRWGIRRLDRITLKLTTIHISPQADPSTILASLDTSPIDLPLTTEPPSDSSWLTKVSIPVFIAPTQNASALLQFVRRSWRCGTVAVHAHIDRVVIQGGSLNDNSWRRILDQQRSEVHTAIHMKIPPLPGLPMPSPNAPFPSISDLITLETFDVSSEPDSISLYARATVVDPIPLSFNFSSPILPFIISLPAATNTSAASTPIAAVHTEPFSLTHPNITLHIAGMVLPIPSSSTPVLSGFIANYLRGQSSPIIISSPYFPSHVIEANFPGPSPKPKLLRNVTIHNMKLVPKGTTFMTAGTVYARVVLPQGMNISMDVNRILPDVLVFDGDVPLRVLNNIDDKDGDPAPPLPDPLPERAFARIRPDQWLDSLSQADEVPGDEGSVYTVTADLVDVPLQILPGREKAFRSFVGKVIFGSDGAVAGLLGSTAVAIDVEGLPSGGESEMELSGLPFRGSVIVGKKSL